MARIDSGLPLTSTRHELLLRVVHHVELASEGTLVEDLVPHGPAWGDAVILGLLDLHRVLKHELVKAPSARKLVSLSQREDATGLVGGEGNRSNSPRPWVKKIQ